MVVNSTTLDYLSIFWSKNGLRCAQTGMGKWLHVQLLAERLLLMTTLNPHSYTLENLWAHPPTAIQGKFRTDTSCDGASSFLCGALIAVKCHSLNVFRKACGDIELGALFSLKLV